MKKLFLAMIIGVTYIIPGLCSASMAISLGVYEDMLDLLSNFYKIKKLKEHIILGIGIIIGILIGVIGFSYLYKIFPFYLNLFFLGIILTGIPVKLIKEKKIGLLKNIIIFIISLVIILSLHFLPDSLQEIKLDHFNMWLCIYLFFVGIIVSLAFILPGISGALLLMVFGLYYPLINTFEFIIADITDCNSQKLTYLLYIGILILGLIIGIILFSRFVKTMIKKRPEIFLPVINGLVFGSFILLISETTRIIPDFISLMIGIPIFIFSYLAFSRFKEIAYKGEIF